MEYKIYTKKEIEEQLHSTVWANNIKKQLINFIKDDVCLLIIKNMIKQHPCGKQLKFKTILEHLALQYEELSKEKEVKNDTKV